MSARRTFTRLAVAGLLGGATLTGAALAGVVVSPVQDAATGGAGNTTAALDRAAATAAGTASGAGATAAAAEGIGAPGSGTPTATTVGLEAGAAKVSIAPRPADYDGVWETDPAKCKTLDPSFLEQLGENPANGAHLAAVGSPWPENPNCIYQGGFGLGPMNPVKAFDTELGLWVRSVAIGDGKDTAVFTIIDGEGWMWDYATKCADCGAEQLSRDLGAELGIDPAGIVIAATHSHASPDFIGGWGFVPDWYMQQVTDAIRESVRNAVKTMEPAVVEVGEVMARQYNSDRRDTYRSAEEQQAGWLRAYVPGTPATKKTDATPPRVVATLGAYAAHPVSKGTNGGVAHADWPGEFEKALEDRFGGVGLHFMTGLGNMSRSGNTGTGLAALIPNVGEGRPVAKADVTATRTTWRQPATNVPLSALGLPGFFDRQFDAMPAQVSVGKAASAPCASASPVSVQVAAGAIKIGDELAVTYGPGELFSNLTNTIKERSPAKVTMPLAQANDALGYIPQSFEMSPVGQQGLGFVAGGVLIVNYEDSYAIDRCFGDAVLENTIAMLNGQVPPVR